MEKKLTVVITTYNREQPLIEQLQSLEKQGLYDKYKIIVSNNCSNYDVEASLKKALSPAFMDIVTVYNRKYNVGGDCNIALSFQLVDTEWMWILSDDDITNPGSIQTVLEDAEKYKDVCWLKYSISGGFKPFEDKRCTSLVEVFDTCNRKNGHSHGEFVFMSNNVYHMPLIEKHIGDVLSLSMTCCPHDVAPMFAVKYEHQPMMFRSFALTNYVAGRISYSVHYAYNNFLNIITSTFKMSSEELRAYRNLTDFSCQALLLSLFEVEESAVRHQYYLRFMNFYKWKNPVCKLACRFIYYPLHYANCNKKDIIEIGRKIKRLLGKKTE